ncbi:unnamed protein product [Nezara viridula]|uniref:Cadherin-related family member 1 n=1 Tax=Nezara viridula TaxID=85310 RepID=A0A9P0MX68_NEZVI|nr:unnamed protein product [Nezara viridula]
MLWEVVVGATLLTLAGGNYPQFDANTQMSNLLLPADARVGSVIYRLRATDSDRDYPLRFAATDYGSYVVRVEDLPCSRKSSACEANVFLERSVSPGQVFKFRLTVRDTSGDTTTSAASIRVTDGVTDFQNVFPHIPGVIMIPEDTKVGTELEYVIVRKHPRSLRPAHLELVGGSEFKINQTSKKDTTTGIILLTLPLDYEVKTMYKLSVYAMGMWTDTDTDSRNVAGFELVVVVSDVQDTPPVWDAIAPITMLSPNLTKGDTVLKVTAKDGDRGLPREVRYALVAEKNPFTVFFDIDPVTGVIRLVRELRELTAISRSHQPILLTVVAEEVVPDGGVGDSSTATVALLLGELGNSPPFFESMSYSTHLPENSLQGTVLVFDDNYITTVKDNDMGKHGVFALSLENNNGTFEISPAVGEREADFVIRVRDNKLLDFEKRTQLVFKIWAREVNPSENPLSTSVDVTVFLTDVNDNFPVFSSANYSAEAPENVTAGYRLVRVEASDADTGDFGVVKFTGIYGKNNNSLRIDEDTGLITIATDRHGFDREQSSSYRFQVEARDDRGNGNRARVEFFLFVLDVNDNVPRFLKNPMEFILGPEGTNFSQAAYIKAVDDDSEPPNNVIRYEILSGNYDNRFAVDQESGEMSVNVGGRRVRQVTLVATLLVRAYDLVKILPALSQSRIMQFLLPGKNLDPRSVETTLTKVTGASKVIIHRIQPYTGQQEGQTTDLSSPDGGEKSIVTATILYDKNAVVDLDDLQKKFTSIANRNSSSVIITHRVEEPEPVYRSETRVLFWILLIFLLLLLLGILTLILCCLCSWCPYYAFFHSLVRKKSSSRSRIVAIAAEKEKPAEKENKSVQAEWQSARARREAWSADERRMWHFGGINDTPRRLLLIPERNYNNQNQPNVVYTRQVSNLVEEQAEKPRQQRQDILLMEDIDGTEYQVLDPSRLREPSTRQSMFIRDGGAEILRLVTRGRNGSEEEPQLNQPQRPFTLENKETEGKVTIMKRFIDDTNGQQMHNKDDKVEESKLRIPGEIAEESEEEKKEDLMKRVMDLDVERDMSTADVNRLTSIQRDILLTRFLVEEQRRARVEDTQSLPGVVTMATQTDKHAETQTDHVYFKRRSKSDNDESPSDSEETAKRKLKRRRRKQVGTVEFRPASRIEISSPIFEEGEELKPHNVNQTKAGLLRQTAVKSRLDEENIKFRSSSDHESTFRRRDVLRSLQVTPIKQMNIINNVLVEHIRYKDPPSLNTQETNTDSMDLSNSKEKQKPDRGGIRSQPPTREPSITPSAGLTPRSQSQARAKTTTRYMDWYKTKKETRQKEKQEKDPIFRAPSQNRFRNKNLVENTTHTKERKRWTDKDDQGTNQKQTMINLKPEPVKEEEIVTRQDRLNQGLDSGTASPYQLVPTQLKNQHFLEKKSIFTIAYDDMETKQLRLDSASSP